MAISKIKLGMAGTLLAGILATPIVVQYRTLQRLHVENAAFRQQLGELNQARTAQEQLAGVQADRDELVPAPAVAIAAADIVAESPGGAATTP